jgi:flavin-dependent dehydrogenase
VGWRSVTTGAGPGFFLAGDAAATLDPAASQGVLKACLGGLLAGHLAAAAGAGAIAPEAAIARHASWLRATFDHDERALRALYRRLPEPPEWAAQERPGGFEEALHSGGRSLRGRAGGSPDTHTPSPTPQGG